jgi:hypothetical protein
MRIVFIGTLATGIVIGSTIAQPVQHWVAVNRITMGATGDLTLHGDRLSFSNDGSIKLRLMKSRARGRWSETNAAVNGDIYKVDPPAKPSSPRGDVLCNVPATYIVLSHPVPSDLDLSVYTSPKPPRGDGSDEACANFSYSQG